MKQVRGMALGVAALLAAGCPISPVPPVTQPSQAPLTRKNVTSSIVTGKLIAPSNIIAADGASIIAADGASVIATGGLNIIAADGASAIAPKQRRVLQAKEVRIANAEVFLADAAGEPIPGLPAVKTNAQGVYTVPNVPAGYTYLVVARIAQANGQPARLTTLARSTPQGVTAPISGESTLASTGVIRRFSGALGEFNQARFSEAMQLVRDNMASVGQVNWASLSDVSAKLDALEKRVSALETALADLRAQVTKIEKTLEDLKADVEKIQEGQASPSPSPVAPASAAPPTPSPSPSATPRQAVKFALPTDFVRGLNQTSYEPGTWIYGHSNGSAAEGPFGLLQWGRHSSGNDAYMNKVAPDGALVAGSTTDLYVHPSINDTVVTWVAPEDGTLDLVVRARLQSEKSNGINLTVFVYRPLEFKATPVVAGDIRVGPAPEYARMLELSKNGVEIKANNRINFHINANGGTGYDTTQFSAEILFTPKP